MHIPNTVPLAFVFTLAAGACSNAPIDPLELIATDISADVDRPELSVMPDGTLRQRYLVLVRRDLFFEGYANDVIVDAALSGEFRLERVYRSVMGGFAAALTDAQIAALRARPDIEAVVPDQRVDAVADGPDDPDDAARPGPPPAPPPTDWGLVDVLGAAWATTFGAGNGGGGVNVAVLDTGVDDDHPNLIVAGCLGNFSSDDDALGCADGEGHGTHVSGTIAATSSSGHRGVAPNVSLFSAKVLGANGSGSTAGIAAGIDAAAAAGMGVLNLSLGGQAFGDESVDPLCVAINDAAAAGTASVVAAGNEKRDAAGFSPARCDQALTVAAHDVNGKLASFTNYGADIDVSAPGVSIYSTTRGGSFGRKSGTSMASPHAAAVAALFVAANPGASVDQVRAGVVANSADRGAPSPYNAKIKTTAPKLDGRDY